MGAMPSSGAEAAKGVNVTLERMSRRRNLSSVAATYIYGALLVAGPWIFTVLGLTGLSWVCRPMWNGDRFYDDLAVFRSIVIYNSMFSLIITSPVAFLCARYVSNELEENRSENIVFAFMAALFIFAIAAAALTGPFYLFATTLEGPVKAASIQSAIVLGVSWLLIPFLRALRRHNVALLAFGAGALAMIAIAGLLEAPSLLSMLLVFNGGVTLINLILAGALIRQFGAGIKFDPGLFKSLRRFWQLPLAGLAYALGLWIDKIIMWHATSTGGLRLAGALWTMPSYDTSMFWAQLASIPILAIFFVHVETQFSTLLRKFYERLDQRASSRELLFAIRKIRVFVISSLAGMFVALAVLATTAVLFSIVFMSELGLRPSYMSIQRISLYAMVFHTTAMLCFMFLLYFDLRRQALLIVCAHLAFNTALTLALLPAGPNYYGYGNMLSSALTLLLALVLVSRECRWLHYHACITNNTSL